MSIENIRLTPPAESRPDPRDVDVAYKPGSSNGRGSMRIARAALMLTLTAGALHGSYELATGLTGHGDSGTVWQNLHEDVPRAWNGMQEVGTTAWNIGEGIGKFF